MQRLSLTPGPIFQEAVQESHMFQKFQNLEQTVKQRALTTIFHRIVLTIEKINPVVSDFTFI